MEFNRIGEEVLCAIVALIVGTICVWELAKWLVLQCHHQRWSLIHERRRARAILANDLIELRRRRALIQEVQSNRKSAITDKLLAAVQARMEEIATKGVARD